MSKICKKKTPLRSARMAQISTQPAAPVGKPVGSEFKGIKAPLNGSFPERLYYQGFWEIEKKVLKAGLNSGLMAVKDRLKKPVVLARKREKSDPPFSGISNKSRASTAFSPGIRRQALPPWRFE